MTIRLQSVGQGEMRNVPVSYRPPDAGASEEHSATCVFRHIREMADLQFLLNLSGIDEAEIREYFEKSGLLRLFDEITR